MLFRSNYLPGPESFEEVGHIVKVHIAASAADAVSGNKYLFGIWMFLGKFHNTLFITVVYVVRGFDFYGNTCVTYDSIHLYVFICVPVGKFLIAIRISKIGDNLLNNEMLEGVSIFRRLGSKLVSLG